jgi:hypothetical protein
MHMQERIHQASPDLFSSYAQQDLFRSTMHGLGITGPNSNERASSSCLREPPPAQRRRIINSPRLAEDNWKDKPKFILRKAMGDAPTSVHERVLKRTSPVSSPSTPLRITAAIFQSLSVASGWLMAAKSGPPSDDG